jgi:hypothetical protein
LVVPAIVAASSPSSTISTAVGTNARNYQTIKLNNFRSESNWVSHVTEQPGLNI